MSLHGEDNGYVYPGEHVFEKSTDVVPRISAGMDELALLSNGGLQCNSVPIQVQRWPFIIQKCERPIRARYLALEYGHAFQISIHKIYVSGKGKRTFLKIIRVNSSPIRMRKKIHASKYTPVC